VVWVYTSGSAARPLVRCHFREYVVYRRCPSVGCPHTSPAVALPAASVAVPTSLSATLHRDPVIATEKPPCNSVEARHANPACSLALPLCAR
jgi:hypothetical protein